MLVEHYICFAVHLFKLKYSNSKSLPTVLFSLVFNWKNTSTFPALGTLKHIFHTAATYCVATVIQGDWSVSFQIVYLKTNHTFQCFYQFGIISSIHYCHYLKIIKRIITYGFTTIVLLAYLVLTFNKTFLTNCMSTVYQ